ncbi:ABC transporter substrate-binding protein [Mesorhizobium sp. M6A.T.Ce.TU.002.03.1.1]|uniref:ABC transporter substrate-binding protein n=1 Tax=Mesorhizobium sp. M6A.T.Ce.TU.002.03.1.1 TaxID=2496782 RepID=UPI000FCCB2E3|nr:ABC transporter substrate-binding protein [Mesorhizobium sp. M6A.T.Ce.TU.002.03.1.1]RUU37654.1 ABC transporter substrate-binding protein [Mesorhizobium sp. M6A.T.Ce.TU.002.03.1.1]
MIVSRRDIFKIGMAGGAALSIPSILRAKTGSVGARTVRMVMNGDLTTFDPILTTTGITFNHSLAIYDTLFALDSKLMPQPQMIEKWDVSDDKKTYTFELRDGLGWHDSTPVTAADCVASLRRWAQVDAGGQLIMSRTTHISKKDDKTFTIVLNEPLGVLVELLAGWSGYYPAIMRVKDANRPATEHVTSNIGSGPFRFNEALAKPGASFAYDKNEKYVPRREPTDGFAGGKVVNVDRIIWNVIGDQQTALAALQAGEVDFLESPPGDLYPVIERDPNLVLQVLNSGGLVGCLRLNCLQKPFDNVKARQAILHLIDQESTMRIMSPDTTYGKVVTSIFGNDSLYSNDENTGWFKPRGDPEKAKQLFKEAGYAGEKVVILQPTNVATYSNACQFLAAELRKIGVHAELASSDLGGLVARRLNKGPAESGGWNMFVTDDTAKALGDPISGVFLTANGEEGWYGWPKNDEYEALRAKWPDVETLVERKALARKMQRIWWDFVGDVYLGQFVSPAAHSKLLTGLISMPSGVIPMWHMQKA